MRGAGEWVPRGAGVPIPGRRLGRRRLRILLRVRGGRARFGRVVRFGMVGTSGIAVNEASIALFVSGFGLPPLAGYLLATQCSTLWNFVFIEKWAFRSVLATNRRWHRFVMLMLVNNAANFLTAPLFWFLTNVVGIHYLVSNLLSLAIVFAGRFALAERIWIPGALTQRAGARLRAVEARE